MIRGLTIGTFCAVFALAMSLGSDGAFAKGKSKKRAAAPVAYTPAPVCPPLFIPVCWKPGAKGCNWSCRPIFFPPLWFVP